MIAGRHGSAMQGSVTRQCVCDSVCVCVCVCVCVITPPFLPPPRSTRVAGYGAGHTVAGGGGEGPGNFGVG